MYICSPFLLWTLSSTLSTRPKEHSSPPLPIWKTGNLFLKRMKAFRVSITKINTARLLENTDSVLSLIWSKQGFIIGKLASICILEC